MKKRYQGRVYVIQNNGERQQCYSNLFRFKLIALIVCGLVTVTFSDLVEAGLVQTQIEILPLA